MKTLFIAALLASSVSFANENKAKDLPECSAIAKSCEAASFNPGDHKKNGQGLWVDCIGNIAKGKTVSGISGHTQEEAQKCMTAMKQHRAQKK